MCLLTTRLEIISSLEEDNAHGKWISVRHILVKWKHNCGHLSFLETCYGSLRMSVGGIVSQMYYLQLTYLQMRSNILAHLHDSLSSKIC